jgi:glutamate/tyrosine decarboxylase-like PLP-dependent enzyme
MAEATGEPKRSGGVFADMHPYRDDALVQARLPKQGRDRAALLGELRRMAGIEDARWASGQVSGTYYHGGKEHYAFLNQVFGLFSHVNLLQRDLCPSGTKFEAEIVSMVAGMLNGDAARARDPNDEVCGAVTFGGSESIMLPMLAYREWAREERGVTEPEMVVPSTIHPAFDKGAHYFGIRLVHVPVGRDHLADVDAMRARVGPNTIAIAGSAANYPHGLIDPLDQLSELALERGIGFHVDGCLGGFLLPWIERLGYPVPPFDFRLPGVTSMSCDTHKWGYGLKGASVVLYRSRALRRRQYFAKIDWPGGLYASPTMAGSRSGGLAASTWAAMVALGEEGYLDAARRIMRAADAIQVGIAAIPELEVFGKPTFCIAFGARELDVFHVNDFLAARGWRLNGLQNPPGVHLCVTLPQARPGVAERFVADLREGVAYARSPAQEKPRSGAVYGGGAALDRRVVAQMMLAWLDETYEV